MEMNAKYVHTNLIAEDWKKLAKFYQDTFGCEPVLPERDFKGDDLDAGTGISNAHLEGVHLRLPGFAEDGPTLEIFSYTPKLEKVEAKVNRPGYGHIAFRVDDVEKAREKILNSGGKEIGKVVTLKIKTGAKITWCYVTDPEGNIIELQRLE
jgi:catechol 2,3-dioxygenase-like lactoylglutathione lyase family enzyme